MLKELGNTFGNYHITYKSHLIYMTVVESKSTSSLSVMVQGEAIEL